MMQRFFILRSLALIAILGVVLPHNVCAEEDGAKTERKVKYWQAPMNPAFISDKPGKSPMGMDLIPVYEDEDSEKKSSKGTIKIDPVVVQNMGVRISTARRSDISRKVRTIGEVVVAEDKLSVVNLRFSGWIEKIIVDETGEFVKEGDPLFEVYSPELVSAQGEYLLALKTSGRKSELALSTRNRLLFWDLKEEDIRQIEKNRRIMRTVTIRSPGSGYILKKNVVSGAHVKAGADLYEIGDLKDIWVDAEVYEFDAPWVKVGQKASMELSFEQGRMFEGHVSYVYPTLNKHSRTLTVRLEFPNPDLRLRPGMFSTVWIDVEPRIGVLAIPTEAILHSGERQVVFVSPRLGRYEAREVVTGITGSNRQTEILKGIQEGEDVVISGQFLLDSESQLQEAIGKLLDARLQSKKKQRSGMKKSEGRMEDSGMDGMHSSAMQDKATSGEESSYWTCGMHPHVVQDNPGTCPICGMNLVERSR